MLSAQIGAVQNQGLLFFACMPYCLIYYWIKIEGPGKNPRFLFMSNFIIYINRKIPDFCLFKSRLETYLNCLTKSIHICLRLMFLHKDKNCEIKSGGFSLLTMLIDCFSSKLKYCMSLLFNILSWLSDMVYPSPI